MFGFPPRTIRVGLLAAVAVAASFAPARATSQSAIFDNTNIDGVSNGNSSCVNFTVSVASTITEIDTYHYNGGRGAPPGRITLKKMFSIFAGDPLGTYAAQGSSGQGGANENWTVHPNVTVQPGLYCVDDSDPSTWSVNAQSKRLGFVKVYGVAASAGAPTVPGKGALLGQPSATATPYHVVIPGKPPGPGIGSTTTTATIKPCYVNSSSLAASGPCFGNPGSILGVTVYRTTDAPYTEVLFKAVVANGMPALVTSPLAGSAVYRTTTIPAQLCIRGSGFKWQVWLANATRSLGQIGDFTIKGCP
jgi:hypothetical protein